MKEFETLWVVTWFRYVNDTFVIIIDLKVVNQLLNLMNTKHKNIKFTCEIEKNKKLANWKSLTAGKLFIKSIRSSACWTVLGKSVATAKCSIRKYLF